MKAVIAPVPTESLEKELTPERFLRPTNNGGNEIYIVTAADSPNLMREIGRLREVSFREGGGGTGADVDIDELDLDPEGYKQLIVWDPKAKEIVGGYRFIVSRTSHPKCFSTEHYFRFTDKFREEYLPYTIELGRSFVQPHYQGSRANPKGLYSLDNLWDGLGALVLANPDIRYFFGKVTMYGTTAKPATCCSISCANIFRTATISSSRSTPSNWTSTARRWKRCSTAAAIRRTTRS